MSAIRTLLLGLFLAGEATAAGEGMSAGPPLPAWAEESGLPPLPAGWRVDVGTYARVHAEPGSTALARQLLQHSEEAVGRLAAELGLQAGSSLDIILAPDEQSFRDLQPGRSPEWADGTAWPAQGLIFLKSPLIRPPQAAPLHQVLDHELVHVILGQAFAPREVPRWLQEGAAQILARELSPSQARRLTQAASADALIPIDELTRGFPADATRARLAYAQSADLVAWMRNRWGEKAFQGLVRDMARGDEFDRAWLRHTGVPVREIDQRWRETVTASNELMGLAAADEVLFTVAGLGLAYGAWRARRRKQEKLDRWAREEAIQDELARLHAEGRLVRSSWAAETQVH
jgi:hypothetical protein